MTNQASATAANASPQVIGMIERLIAFPTVSRDSNLGLIEWTRDYLRGLGVDSRLTYDSTGKKANLFATLGEGRSGGIILSGHTDTVPVDGQAWSSDPFVASVRDGRIYGRGSADMKSYIATALALAPEFLDRSDAAPVHIALSYDEEVGCIGVRSLIADLKDQGIEARGCIVGEPTTMRPIVAHKGTHRFRCCVRGKEAHSSYTNQGVNAIEYAARLIVRIRQIADRMASEEKKNHQFTVPHSTMQTGLVRGGIAANVVPRDCEFMFEFRTLPGTDPSRIYREVASYADLLGAAMREEAPEAGIQFEQVSSSPGLLMQADDPVVQLASTLSGQMPDGAVSYGTEAGLFQHAGIPTVVCGPGNIEQAHRPDEYVSLEQVALCEAFMRRLARTTVSI
ncbi:MAG TPA: acetylornithine deacetylase [Noviherbaspirillum sp.]|uniref:acetylornithine deacetylase n=1 Tax=Noviherbaspirillum sp. TaxID=1926288 RepID=UPI002F94EEB3